MSYKHICIVDDDLDDIFLMSASLKRIQASNEIRLTISTFNGGEDALDYFAAIAQTPAKLPDCVCVDINMRGMNGIELLERLRGMEHLESLPIYIVSTTIDQKTQDRAASLGATGSFVKPETMEAMQEMQKKFLGLR